MKTNTLIKNLALVAISLAALAMVSCGGSDGGSGTGSPLGRVAVTLNWPKASRLIPANSKAIKVTLTSAEATVSKIGTQADTVVYFDGLIPGNYKVDASAYSKVDASDAPIASGFFHDSLTPLVKKDLVVTAGQTADFQVITMNSEVARLRATLGAKNFDFNNAGLVTGFGGSSLYPVVDGSGTVTVSTNNAANSLVLVNTAGLPGQLTATPVSPLRFSVGPTQNSGAQSGLSGTLANVTASSGFGSLGVGYTEASLAFNLPFLVVRTTALTSANLQLLGVTQVSSDAAPNALSTVGKGNANPAEVYEIQNGSAVSDTTVGVTGFPLNDEIRIGYISGKGIYALSSSNSVGNANINGKMVFKGASGVQVPGATKLLDISTVGTRLFVLADVAVGRRVLELTPDLVAGNIAITKTFTRDMAGYTDISAALDSGSVLRMAANSPTAVSVFSESGTALNDVSGSIPVIAGAGDVALASDLLFVLDSTGAIRTFGFDGKEYDFTITLPGGAVPKRIAASRTGTNQLSIVATYSGVGASNYSIKKEGAN